MASILTHAALPLLIGRVVPLPRGVPGRRLAIAAVACACVPDLDLAAFLLDVHPSQMAAHRGLLHGLPFAAVLATVVTLVWFRSAQPARVAALLFAAAASHGLVDAFTRGGVGVALAAPFLGERVLFPWRPIPTCPLGVTEYLGSLGATVLANELLLVVTPVAIGTEAVRRLWAGLAFNRLTLLTGAWVAVLSTVWLFWPRLFAPTAERPISGYADTDGLARIPPGPDGRLVTRFDELRAQALFDVWLEPATSPWSSGFFPAWYGAEVGRWQDGRLRLIARTLTGFEPMKEVEARAALDADRGWGLSPVEKYDLARGDYGFAATRHSLEKTHNARPRPRFWFGLCNGVATAAIERPEPFRAVDVTNPQGQTVRFHPIDVKALLAVSYAWESQTAVLGGACDRIDFDTGRTCSMNPGTLVVGTLNALGRAKRSFLLEVFPTRQAQYYPVVSGRVRILGSPYLPRGEPFEPGLRARVASLVDVELDYRLSSTLLPVALGDAVEPAEPMQYRKVGVQAVPYQWAATLALDADGEIIGGRWRGDPADGPDNAAFVGGGPLLDGDSALSLHPRLQWPFIDALANASAGLDAGR